MGISGPPSKGCFQDSPIHNILYFYLSFYHKVYDFLLFPNLVKFAKNRVIHKIIHYFSTFVDNR